MEVATIGSKLTSLSGWYKRMMIPITMAAIAPIRYISSLLTASGIPKTKHCRSKCVPRGRFEIRIRPRAKRAVKTIPMAESSLVRLLWLTRLINTAVNSPASKAPSSSPQTPVLLVTRNAMTTPGRMAWERASPINAIRLSTTKHPRTPQVIPTSTLVHKPSGSSSNGKYQSCGSKVSCASVCIAVYRKWSLIAISALSSRLRCPP